MEDDMMKRLPIPGLFLLPSFVSKADERRLLRYLDRHPWSTELARRTLHFGWKYDYRTRSSAFPMEKAIPMTGRIAQLSHILLEHSNFLGDLRPSSLDMCIVNEYTRNQGIAGHIDASVFGPVIYILSLGEDTVMNFIPPSGETVPVYIPRFSILILSGAARSTWKHEIPKRVTYIIDGKSLTKAIDYRRVSLTYRTLCK